ncbi:complex I subunit 5 family protein [Desulfococcus sp.]|uniref:complex I subunit 5 family protein n=1 Tax=Desulfococcus sp. TaxID=2025834 RepID=UPI00359314A3
MNPSHLVLLPIVIPLTGGIIALLLSSRPRLQRFWSLGSMTAALAASLALAAEVWDRGAPVVYQCGGWRAPFGITLVGDGLSALFVVMTFIVMAAGVIYALGSRDAVVRYPAFHPLFLSLAAGLAGAMLTGDLFTMYVFAELLVISGTMLTAASDDPFGAEAAYKYYYMSLMASFFMLLAVGCLYASYGTLNMADLALRIAAEPAKPLLLPAVGFLTAVFMIKSAVFPFHFWQPDFHTAAPTAVSAMLSSVVVKFGVYGFFRMTTLLFAAQAPVIRSILLAVGVAGILFGGLSAAGTHNMKRMLAYSTLAQVGFILVGIGWGTPPALAAAVVFAFNHSMVKAAMLMIAGFVASRAPVKSTAFSMVAGVGRSLPGAGVLFFLGSLGLAGIPPTSGFISKMLLFRSGAGAAQFWVLVIIGAGGALTLIYTMRAFQQVFWEPAAEGAVVKPFGDSLLAPAMLIGLVLLLGLWADPLVHPAHDAARWMTTPLAYVQAVLGGS